MKSKLRLLSLSSLALVLSGCQSAQPRPDKFRVYYDADDGSMFSRSVHPGGAIDWSPPPAWQGRDFEGFPSLIGANKTLEAKVLRIRLDRIPASHPAFARFGVEGENTVTVQVVSCLVTVDKGSPAGTVPVAVLLDRKAYLEEGQRVVFRSYGTPEKGFATLLTAAPARYAERYPNMLLPNEEYSAEVVSVGPSQVDVRHPAYARICETGGRIAWKGKGVECQAVSLVVQADDRKVFTQVYMPYLPVWKRGDIVTYRTFGNCTNGFADIQIAIPAGNGDMPRTPNHNQ